MKSVICAGLLLAAPLLIPATVAAGDEHPDLGGTWILNAAASDDPAQVMRQAGGDNAGGGRGGGKGGRGGGGRGGGGHGHGGDGEREPSPQGQQNKERLQQRLGRLTIFHADPELDYTDGLDISRLLHTDGREDTVWTEQGQVKATATWKGSILEIAWQGERGDRRTRLELSVDRKQLVVLEQLKPEEGGGGTTLRLVYDRSDTSSNQ